MRPIFWAHKVQFRAKRLAVNYNRIINAAGRFLPQIVVEVGLTFNFCTKTQTELPSEIEKILGATIFLRKLNLTVLSLQPKKWEIISNTLKEN